MIIEQFQLPFAIPSDPEERRIVRKFPNDKGILGPMYAARTWLLSQNERMPVRLFVRDFPGQDEKPTGSYTFHYGNVKYCNPLVRKEMERR